MGQVRIAFNYSEIESLLTDALQNGFTVVTVFPSGNHYVVVTTKPA